MSDQYRELMIRVDSLEKKNRRLRRVGGGLLAVLGVVGLMSMAGPRVCKTVWGERFVLRDSHGRDRMQLDAYSSRFPSLTLMNSSGSGTARLLLADDGDMQLQFFSKGKPVGASFKLGPETFKKSKRSGDATAVSAGPSTN